jgi:excisionase family DNA binding protein
MSHPHDPLLTIEEAGELLGTGPGLPRRLVEDGALEHVRRGRDVRIPESELIRYLTIAEATSASGVEAPQKGAAA